MLSVLDTPRQLARIDSEDMLGAIYRFPEPLFNPAPLSTSVRLKHASYTSLVLVGMGGSASAADVLLDWLGSRISVPAIVVREPSIPKFADADTLVICFSYSGETRETLQAFKLARRHGCGLMAVGSGGTLGRLCTDQSVPFFRVSLGVAPRAALSQMVVAGAAALQSFRVVANVRDEILSAGKELARLRRELRPNVPSFNNRAKQFAYQLKRRMPVIYALQRMSSIARRFKNQLAENSKLIAKYDLFPESGHNEVESWGKLDFPCAPVLIRDWEESLEEKAFIQAFKSTITAAGTARPIEVRLRTKSSLSRILGPILFLDYVSAYLAILRRVDPSQTPQIQNYKIEYTKMV